jgi:hypothetical protein
MNQSFLLIVSISLLGSAYFQTGPQIPDPYLKTLSDTIPSLTTVIWTYIDRDGLNDAVDRRPDQKGPVTNYG